MSRDPRWCSSPESSDREDAHPSQRCHRAPARAADPGGDGHRRLGAGRGRSRADPLRLARPARLESPATTSVPASTTKHGAPIAAPADIVRTGGHALDPVQPRAGEQAETIGTRFHAQQFRRSSLSAASTIHWRRGRSGGQFGRLRPARGAMRRAVLRRPARMRRMRRGGEKSASPQMRKPRGRRAAHAPAAVDRVVAGPGRPLEPALRQDMNLDSDTTFQRCGCIRAPPLSNQRETSMPMPTRWGATLRSARAGMRRQRTRDGD